MKVVALTYPKPWFCFGVACKSCKSIPISIATLSPNCIRTSIHNTYKIELDFRLGTQNTSHLYCCTLNPQSKVCISPSLHFFFFDLLIGQKRNLMYVKFTVLLSSMESDQFNWAFLTMNILNHSCLIKKIICSTIFIFKCLQIWIAYNL